MFHNGFFWDVIVFVVLVMKATTEAQNNQVQARVHERVDSFMTVPVTALQTFAEYFQLGGFPNNLQAADRDEATMYMYSLVIAFPSLKPFYGLESGVFLGFLHGSLDLVPRLIYREPGNSGYFEDDEEMNIYLPSCVNRATGDEEMCLMQEEGDTYIVCVDNCTLIQCEDPDSQAFCAILPVEQRDDCESNRKWCRNYDAEQTEVGSMNPRRGFIPRTDSCINAQGAFSQTPGEVLVETPEGIVTDGNCTFDSGALVQRNLSGPFAYCAMYPSGECDTTFLGGYVTRNYDGRWRGWYRACREAQRPRFSDPYIFFSLGHVGITYTHPIYETDDQGRTVFAGVLAADMVLNDITNFLVDSYNETDYYVAIFEDRQPHHMIGVSTGSSTVEYVLRDDNNQVCSDLQRENGQCIAIHLTIEDFGSSQEDAILRKAHLALDETTEQMLSVRERDEEIESPSYMATSLVYEQPGANLRWRIVVVAPIEEDFDDSVTRGQAVFILVCIIGILGFVLCSTLFVLFYKRRNEQTVQFADVSFTSAFIVCCALLNLSTLAMLGENTDELCLLRMWVFWLLASFCLSPLLVKAFRTWRLLGSSVTSAMTVKMSNTQAWLRSLPIPILQTSILLIISYTDPPVATEYIDWDASTILKGVTCEQQTSAFYVVQGLFYLFLIISGCTLAYLTRNIDPRFGDAKALLFAMYNIAFSSLMLSVIFLSVDISVSGRRVLQAIGVFWATVFSSAVFIVPRLMAANVERKKKRTERETLRKSMMPRTSKYSSMTDIKANLHGSHESLKILVCSANLGNAEPTLSSMEAWIPEGGSCGKITPLEGEHFETEKFDLIVIGMQEATWGSKKKKLPDHSMNGSTVKSIGGGSFNDTEDIEDGSEYELGESERSARFGTISMSMDQSENQEAMTKEDAFMAAVEGEDTVALRKMERSLLGRDYKAIAEETRGQMRLHIWARKTLEPYIENVKISGANTGIGNVMANKGGIVISLKCMDTRLTFLAAHLAAHEGESHYKSRCDNVYDILRSSKTFDLSQKFDLAISSHHMFVLGDLNFRTQFDGDNEHLENVRRALKLIEAEDWDSLYGFDELHRGVQEGDLLVDFETLPCNFHPTFKVNRTFGFDYKAQRTPSYTDRILFKSSHNLHDNLKPLAYEPCGDFITSDHKPVRGAFSIIPNDVIEAKAISGRIRFVFSDIQCFDLLAGDVDGFSDPYVMFVWDSVEMAEDKAVRFSWLGRQKWPTTTYKRKTLNPEWKDKKISLVTTGKTIHAQAILYVGVFDYDFMTEDDILGTLPLSIHKLISMGDGHSIKEFDIEQPLERYGKFGGRIKFKLEVSMLVG